MKCMGDVLKIASFGLAFAIPAFASTVNVDVTEEHQVIRGFGGMVHNQWQGGGGLSEADAKIAFGTGDGTIGLNTLRIPVYASSNDFNKEVQAAKYAKKYAGDDFILYATPWTSPYAGANQHMASSNYQKYVDHLNSFNDYMKNQGVPLYAISISNEPDWCGEWACWSADEIYNFTKGYADKMRKNGAKVISTESFRYDKNLYNKVLNDANALKNWDILGAHFYASDRRTGDNFFQYSLADQKKVERWMTEHYTESQGSGNYWRTITNTGDQANANKRDTVNAMDVAYEIHRAMVVGNFNQYTWWYIRRCYGLIMEKDFGNKLQIPQNEIGKISKRGYVMSQFARFVRPGAVRVGATANPEKEVFASAYKSKDGDSVIVVLVNRDYKNSKTVTVNVKGADVETFHVYTTSEAKNAKYEGEVEVKNGSVTITMDAGNSSNKDCIVTLVGSGTPADPVPREPFGGKVAEIPGKIEAENFDVPGTGKGNKSYSENDSEDRGETNYREGTGVDIYKKATGYVVGYNEEGEWLEYSVNVKEAGDYTMFASVATSNSTSGFSLSLDGKTLVENVALSGTSFDEFTKVKANVTLPAGEHILRMTVTGSWFDIDYFNFAKGKDAADPDDKTIGLRGANFRLPTEAENYSVFDVNGVLVGKFMATTKADVQRMTKSVVRQNGIYFVKSLGGKSYRISVAK
ncbi:carbohydrate-binding protein [Fibrobacter succinogenes]|uniref:Glycosyl hydrolase family 30 n=1 Tax=Fibrobacter succinogenes TaxID=833 RepID=A0A380S4X5_FIBSU|nr:carbohydrate-binding protein [Fibrobacter succinogenes]PWJ35602.1 O-glycosyl hydrolase [Fibrobacter succinogenes subsp. elongatus]SUQ24257.1 glycosyl hydrolase family 30 [Fibrobacter succinogenes]